MARKRLSDLLEEETKKVTQIEDAAAIDVKATPVEHSSVEENEKATDSRSTKRTNVTKADLEATVKELKETLEQAHQNEATFEHKISDLQSALSKQEGLASELEKELHEAKKLADLEVTVQELQEKLEQAQHNEETLKLRVNDLQTAIAAKGELTERLKKELYQAKQDAVKLAEINSALTEQINGSKQQQLNNSKQQQKQKSAIQPAKSNLRPASYRKSHIVTDKRPITRSPKPSGPSSSEDSSNSSSEMWLLD